MPSSGQLEEYYQLIQFDEDVARIYEIKETLDSEELQELYDMCENYYEAILFTLIFLFEEKKSKISKGKIVKIIEKSFNLKEGDAKKIVACYSGSRTNKKRVIKKKKDLYFSSIMMDYACKADSVQNSKKDEPVNIPEKIKEEILKISNYTLPVSDILSATVYDNGIYMSSENHQISKHHINIVRKGIKKFNRVFAKFPHKEYWSLFFKYMPKISHNGYIINYLLLFPKLDDSCIEKFTHASISSLSYEDFQFQYNYLSPLRDYETELARLDITPPNDFNEEDQIKLLSTLTVCEFTKCLSMIGNMEVIAEFKLRPIDLRAIHTLLMCYSLDILDSIFLEDTLIPLFESGQHMRQN